MKNSVRWVFVLLPCVPGLTLLLAALVLRAAGQSEPDAERLRPLVTAGSAVLLAGVVVGAFVAWRITHPRPEPDEKELPPLR